jgi:hypothetical protein
VPLFPRGWEFQFRDSGVKGSGIQARTAGSGNQKPRGITPTTVRGLSSSVIRVPRIDGVPPISCHRPKLNIATGSAPGTSSPARNPRTENGARTEHVEQLGRCADDGHEARRPGALADHHVSLAEQRDFAEARNAPTDVQVFLVGPVRLLPEDSQLALVG